LISNPFPSLGADKELIHKFVEKFATKDSFDKFCKLGAGEYRRSGMGSRASTMDLKEFLAYLNHLHLVPSRLTKSTAVGIFTAVNKGTKNGGASKHVEKAVVEIEKDVHDDDAHELSFDEFFECMRRVAIRLAVTDCDEATYDGMNAQLGEHKPVYFCTVDSVDYAQVPVSSLPRRHPLTVLFSIRSISSHQPSPPSHPLPLFRHHLPFSGAEIYPPCTDSRALTRRYRHTISTLYLGLGSKCPRQSIALTRSPLSLPHCLLKTWDSLSTK
jgi:hypothetical protein